MDPFRRIASFSPGDVIETDIGGERVRITVIRLFRFPESPTGIGMYGAYQFLNESDEEGRYDENDDDDSGYSRRGPMLKDEGYLFASAENGHEHLEILNGADERKAALEHAKLKLVHMVRLVTSEEDPILVCDGLWLVEIEGKWVNCTRADNVPYGERDSAAVFISARPDINGFTVFTMFDVISEEDPVILRTMNEDERADVHARFVAALYGTEAETASRDETGEEPIYH